MRASSSVQLYSIFLLFLTTLTVAFPWPKWLPERDALMVRQVQSSSAAAPAPSRTASPSPSETPDNNSADNKSSGTAAKSGTATGKVSSSAGKATGSATGTKGPITSAPSTTEKSSGANHTSYDVSNPAGAIVLITPAVVSGSQFYKVGDNVTFAWNYTNLLGSPTALNVFATNSLASNYYTMTANMSIGRNATNALTWDTAQYTLSPSGITDPLLTAEYTLIIYDADIAISATAEPGYLGVYNQYRFGMYTPQPYTDLQAGYKCSTCSGAMSDMERRFLGFVFGMGLVTVLSFTWFVTGTGVIW